MPISYYQHRAPIASLAPLKLTNNMTKKMTNSDKNITQTDELVLCEPTHILP